MITFLQLGVRLCVLTEASALVLGIVISRVVQLLLIKVMIFVVASHDLACDLL